MDLNEVKSRLIKTVRDYKCGLCNRPFLTGLHVTLLADSLMLFIQSVGVSLLNLKLYILFKQTGKPVKSIDQLIWC